MRQDCRSLCRITPGQYGHVLVPTQEMLFPTLPSSGKVDAQHNPFPDKSVTIQAFGDQIDVMNSLMAPVVIRITGSDGVTYKFLCKPKDDLRKDSRMMDFNTMINRLLVKDVDSRRRNLYIRTFSVVPLNESTGMIQWVDNTTVLRSILTGLYQKTYGAEKVRTNRLAVRMSCRWMPDSRVREALALPLRGQNQMTLALRWLVPVGRSCTTCSAKSPNSAENSTMLGFAGGPCVPLHSRLTRCRSAGHVQQRTQTARKARQRRALLGDFFACLAF